MTARQWVRELCTDLRDAHRLGREFHAESMTLLRTWLRLSRSQLGGRWARGGRRIGGPCSEAHGSPG